MKQLIVFSFLFFFININICVAQNHTIDSLKNELQKANTDTSRVNILNGLGWEFAIKGIYGSSMKSGNDAKNLAEKISYPKGAARALTIIGGTYYFQGYYEEALKNYFEALKIQEEIGDKHGIADSYNNTGLIYEYQGKDADALENYVKALQLYKETGDKSGESRAYDNIGNIYSKRKDYGSALKNYSLSLTINKETGNRRSMAIIYNNIGDVYETMNNYPSALNNYQEALNLFKDAGDKRLMAIGYSNVGSVFRKQNKFTDARKYLMDGLQLAKEIGAKDFVKESYSGLAKLSEAIGDYKMAYEYNKLYAEMKDSLLNETSSKQMAEMKTKYETEKKEKELATLTIANELQIQKTKRRNSYILAMASLFLLILSGLWFQSYKRKKRLTINEKEIEKKNLELKNQDLAIEKGKAEERVKVQKEIADQYHDILGAKITSLLLMCENEKNDSTVPGTDNEFANRVSLKIKEIAETNRSGIIALDPDTEQLDSFIAKLHSDLYDMVETAGKAINFITPPQIPLLKVEPIIKFNLSAIMKEAINNSIKYSHTNGVTVQIEIKPPVNLINHVDQASQRYVISIIDNGVGIDPEKKKSHSYGLRNMEHRMESIGGTCQVISVLNKGTTVRLEGNLDYKNTTFDKSV